MNKGHFLKMYYCLALSFGLFSTYYHFRNKSALAQWDFKLTIGDSITGGIAALVLILSLVVTFLVLAKRIEKLHLIFPALYLFTFVWTAGLHFLIYSWYGYPEYLAVLDRLDVYNIIFYALETIIPLYLLPRYSHLGARIGGL